MFLVLRCFELFESFLFVHARVQS